MSNFIVFAKDIKVGDGNGWTNGIDYSDWASSQTFNVYSDWASSQTFNVGDKLECIQYSCDDNGWTNGIDYSDWASSQTFNVGDKLLFTYGFTHSLDEVSKDNYENCNTGNPINFYSSSPTYITLTKAGPMYFTCPRSNHCSQGMKLAINVTPTSTTPGGSPPSPPSATTPSPPWSSTTPDIPPSQPSATAPPTPTGGATRIFVGFCPLMVVSVALFMFVA